MAGESEFPAVEAAAVDALAASYQRRGGQPGIVYGIVAGGRLVHAGGLGQPCAGDGAPGGGGGPGEGGGPGGGGGGSPGGGGPAPDAGTVFRVASMTKSFTASAVLALRDEGAFGLDDLAENYVPELRGWAAVTPDAPRVRIRHLLTMTAGFPTDDPWGDRQQGTPLPEFSEFLSGGVSFAWVPGTRFEYSNLGYAILGRVISAVSGTPYADFIRSRLLAPLGMTRTGFDAAEFQPAELAAGHRREGSGWARIEPAPYGAFAPMGGVFSCVRDLAAWVAGFAAAFPPGGEAAGGPHPLSRSTRREMQLPQVATGMRGPAPLLGAVPTASYGFGLFVEDDPAWGRSSSTAAVIPASAATCAGTRPPASASSSWGTARTRRSGRSRPGCCTPCSGSRRAGPPRVGPRIWTVPRTRTGPWPWCLRAPGRRPWPPGTRWPG